MRKVGSFGSVIASLSTWSGLRKQCALLAASLHPVTHCSIAMLSVKALVRRWLRIVLSRCLTKWFSSTRLETRTKESNIYASIWVENPECAMKVNAGWDPVEGMHHRPI